MCEKTKVVFCEETNVSDVVEEHGEPLDAHAPGITRILLGVNAAFFALSKKDRAVEKSFGNFGNIEVGEMRNLNPLNILNYKYLIISEPAEALKALAKS